MNIKDKTLQLFRFETKESTQKGTPATGSSYKRDINNRSDLSYDNSLTPQALSSALREANDGDMTRLQGMFTKMEEADTRVKSALQTRRNAVASRKWYINPASEEESDKKIAEFVDDYLNNIINFKESMEHLLCAIGGGYSVCEINWEVSNEGEFKFIIPNLINIPPGRIDFTESYTPQLLNADFNDPQPLEPNKYLIFTYDAKSGLINRAGVMRSIATLYMLKSYALGDWARYSELAGVPYRIAKYKQGANNEDKTIVRDALESLGTDLALVIPDNFDIEIATVAGGASGNYKTPQQGFIEWIDRSISQVVLGQTLTTDGSDGGAGSFALGKIHGEVKDDLITDDAVGLAKVFTEQLITPIVEFHFGFNVDIPEFQYDLEVTPDLVAEIKIDEVLFKNIGLPVSTDYLYNKYNVPPPEEDAELLQLPSTTAVEEIDVEEDPEDDKTTNTLTYSKFDATMALFADNPENRPLTTVESQGRIDDSVDSAVWFSAQIMERFLLQIDGLISGSSTFTQAIKGIDNYTLSEKQVADFGDEFKFTMIEMYNFGRFAINPNTTTRTFADGVAGISMDLAPENIINYLKVQSMTVAHVTHTQTLESIKQALISSAATGQTYAEFAREINKVFLNTGVSPLNPFHLETVYLQNGINAYQTGKFAEMTNDVILAEFPYWQYRTAGDEHVRPTHQAMNGHTALNTDSVWIEWYPPNGFRCRCDVELMTQAEADKLGIKKSAGVPENPNTGEAVQPDKKFRTNPANAVKSFSQWADKAIDYSLAPSMYATPPLPVINSLPVFNANLSQSSTLINPDEIWGYLEGDKSIVTYFKSFNDGGKIATFKVVVTDTSAGQAEVMSKVKNMSKERIGVPIPKEIN